MTPTQVGFFVNIENIEKSYFEEHLRTAASMEIESRFSTCRLFSHE